MLLSCLKPSETSVLARIDRSADDRFEGRIDQGLETDDHKDANALGIIHHRLRNPV